MNDLAEKALEALDAARRQVRDRPMVSLAAAGLLTSSVVVVAGGRVGAAISTRTLTTWLGLLVSGRAPAHTVPATILLSGVAALVVLWICAVSIVRSTRHTEARVWWLAVAWGAPFAVGPPLMDTSAYSYAAYGLLQRAGLNPYTQGVARLGDAPVVLAIDPASHPVLDGVGPLGALVQHLSVSVAGGSALGAVIVLRVLAVLSAVAIGHFAADLAGWRRSEALALTVLNPLVLLYIVSAAHLDGLLIALMLAALVAANQQRWAWAVVLTCVAGSLTAQGFIALPMIIVVHWLGRGTVPGWRVIGRDVATAITSTVAFGLIVAHGFGWLHTLDDQFSTHTPFALASVVGDILAPIVPGASFDDLAAGGRLAMIIAAVCACGYLAVTARARALNETLGYALLALGLLAPVLHPWYLLWGTLCLAPTAGGVRRDWLVLLTGMACVLTPPGFSTAVSNQITAAAFGVAALAMAARLAARRQARGLPRQVSAGG